MNQRLNWRVVNNFLGPHIVHHQHNNLFEKLNSQYEKLKNYLTVLGVMKTWTKFNEQKFECFHYIFHYIHNTNEYEKWSRRNKGK